MVLSTKATGLKTWHKDLVHFITQMVTFMKENGKKTKLMVKEHIGIKTEPNMQDNGLMMYNMDKGMRLGPMGVVIRECTIRVRSMGGENISGLMVANMMANGCKIKFMDLVHMNGQMAGLILVNG